MSFRSFMVTLVFWLVWSRMGRVRAQYAVRACSCAMPHRGDNVIARRPGKKPLFAMLTTLEDISARAAAVHARNLVWDAHCDTLVRALVDGSDVGVRGE